jgi:AraC-like DNA-binding protein
VDIALALSFSSQANFTRAFTKATGQAPGQFRGRNGVRSLAIALLGHTNKLQAGEATERVLGNPTEA